MSKLRGALQNIDIRNIHQILGRDDFHKYLKEQRIFACFGYQPHTPQFLSKDPDDVFVYNTYSPPFWKKPLFFNGQVKKVGVLPSIYKTYFEHLTAYDQPSFDYLIDWMATSLQDRNLTILCAIGEEGIGKGILGEILEDLHGMSNFVKVRDNVFKGKFNGPLDGKTLVYVDEIKLESKEALDRIKDVVNWQIEIERKGEDPISVRNYASFYLSSNSFDAIPIEPGQRRFSVIQLTDDKLKDTSIYEPWGTVADYVKELRSEANIAALAGYLIHKQVTRRMIDVFLSERLEEIKNAGLKNWERWVIEEWAPNGSFTQSTVENLQDRLKDKFPSMSPPSRRKIEDLAKNFPNVLQVKRKDKDRYIQITCAKQVATKTGTAASPTSEGERIIEVKDKTIVTFVAEAAPVSDPIDYEEFMKMAENLCPGSPTDPIFQSEDFLAGQKLGKLPGM